MTMTRIGVGTWHAAIVIPLPSKAPCMPEVTAAAGGAQRPRRTWARMSLRAAGQASSQAVASHPQHRVRVRARGSGCACIATDKNRHTLFLLYAEPAVALVHIPLPRMRMYVDAEAACADQAHVYTSILCCSFCS